MNLYIKYCPLGYTLFTRILPHKTEALNNWSRIVISDPNKSIIKSLINYLYWLLMRIFPLFVIFLQKECSLHNLLLSILIYIYIQTVFLIFYEIWYLHNDLCATKKEKNPTIHILWAVKPAFYYKNILLRILLWTSLLIPIFNKYNDIALGFCIIIMLTLLIYYLHNIVRNYFYNRITLNLLRFMKMSLIFIPIYFLTNSFQSEQYTYITTIFLIHQYFSSMRMYWERFWYKINKLRLPLWLLQHWYQCISMIILFLINKNLIFLIYWIISLILFLMTTPKKYFKIENNR